MGCKRRARVYGHAGKVKHTESHKDKTPMLSETRRKSESEQEYGVLKAISVRSKVFDSSW